MACDVVIHGQRLTRHEQVFFAPVARQCLGDLLRAGFNADVAVLGQSLGIAVAGHDGADNGLASRAHDVADYLGKLDIHLHQSLLHALHPTGLFRNQHLTLAGNRAPKVRRQAAVTGHIRCTLDAQGWIPLHELVAANVALTAYLRSRREVQQAVVATDRIDPLDNMLRT